MMVFPEKLRLAMNVILLIKSSKIIYILPAMVNFDRYAETA